MQSNQNISTDKVNLSLSEIEARLAAVRFPDFDMIVAIASGGRVPAGLIARRLALPLKIIEIKYRMADNRPLYDQPRLINADEFPAETRRLLLVDDVSVSGKTMQTARKFLSGHTISTFVLKGKADFVLFPEIKRCVNWPWHGKA